ncbi:MAG: MFS transporter [Deltaproteobacteria bacterium]|nr:MFS transporter [Deltaproteobacteria bacterium]MBW2445910.1 MFS transporter [Deltaproteobacteria bacterium]
MSEAKDAPDPSDGEAALQAEAGRNLKRNFAVLIVHGLLGQTGFRMIQAPTFIPTYIFLLSGSELVVGLARAAQAFGQFLTPILSANLVEHRRRVMPIAFLVGGGMRVQVLGIALAGFFLGTQANVIAVCVFLGLFGFFLGMQGVVFNLLVSKVVPVGRRGVLQGTRGALGAIAGAVVGGIGGGLVARDAFGNGYAAVFLLSFVFTALGLVSLAFIREPDSPSLRDATPLGRRLTQLPHLLRSDPSFTRYLLARSLGVMGRMAMPFYIVYVNARLDLTGRQLGELTVAFVLSQGLLNLAYGLVADRRGFRFTFLVALAVWMAAGGMLLVADSYAQVLVAYFALGAGLGGFMMSSQNLALEFGSRANLPMRIAVANSASEAVGIAAPLLGGFLAVFAGYPTLIGVAIGFQAIAFGVTLFFVDEPRHRTQQPL